MNQKRDSIQVGRFALVTERVGTGDCSTPGRPSLRPLREHALRQFERLWAAKLVHGDVAARNLTIDSIGRVIILDLGLARAATPEAIARERHQVECIFS
jgi:RIO-like serine/threonine protein kinase